MKTKAMKNFSVKIYPEVDEHEEYQREFFEGIYTYLLGRTVHVTIIPEFDFAKLGSPVNHVIPSLDMVSDKNEAAIFCIQTCHTLAIIANDVMAGTLHVYNRGEDDSVGIYYVSKSEMNQYIEETEKIVNAEFTSTDEIDDFYTVNTLMEKFEIVRLIYKVLAENDQLLSEYNRKILAL